MTKQVSPRQAAELLTQGWRYLDVRSIPEYDAGHPEGAVNVPLLHAQTGRMVPNPDFQAVVERNFPREEKLVVGCKMAGRSAQAAALLEAAGYTNVILMRGGYAGERDQFGRLEVKGWRDEGLPTSTTGGPGHDYQSLAEKGA